jgi:hypothetical protein
VLFGRGWPADAFRLRSRIETDRVAGPNFGARAGDGADRFLWQPDPVPGNFAAARPMVSCQPRANCRELASREGAACFRDFARGSYKPTVQPYGTPARQSETLQPAPAMQTYVQIQALPNREEGWPVCGCSFAVLHIAGNGQAISADDDLSRPALIAAPTQR